MKFLPYFKSNLDRNQ